MFVIKGQYELADFTGAQKLHSQANGLANCLFYNLLIWLGLGTVAGVVLATVGRIPWYYAPLLAVTLAFAAFMQFVWAPRRMARLFEQQKDLHVPFEIDLSTDHFLFRNEYGENRIPWDHIVKWKEDDRLLMLYRSDLMFHLIPKRFLAGEEELRFVRERLAEYKIQTVKPLATRRLMIIIILLLIAITCMVILQVRAE